MKNLSGEKFLVKILRWLLLYFCGLPVFPPCSGAQFPVRIQSPSNANKHRHDRYDRAFRAFRPRACRAHSGSRIGKTRGDESAARSISLRRRCTVKIWKFNMKIEQVLFIYLKFDTKSLLIICVCVLCFKFEYIFFCSAR